MVHVWKRQCGFLSGLISKSGNSWNPIQKKVECTKESWDEACKGYGPMKNKMDDHWPFYEDWIEIFGKDRATGDNSINFGEAANGVLNKTMNEALNKDTVNEDPNINAEISEFNETDFNKVNGDFLPTGDDCDTASGSGSNLVRKKRKAVSSICEDGFVEVVSNFVKKTDETLVQMVKSLAPEKDDKTARQSLFEALDMFPILTMSAKVAIGRKLAKDKEELEFFLSLPHEARLEFVIQMSREL